MLSLEQRLSRNEDLRVRYKATIEQDLENGYVRKVGAVELGETQSSPQCYLLHHPVVNPHKPEKLRRVCNAASTFGKFSLNQALLTGPDLSSDLVGILVRFRENSVAVAADVEAMFMQVKVSELDQRMLRFLWREDPSKEVEVVQYTRHIFGAKSSPTCANFVLQQIARQSCEEFPLASRVALGSFYMDDLLKSVPSESEAVRLGCELVKMLSAGGFSLVKWVSSSKDVFEKLRSAGVRTAKESFDENQIISVLGLEWKIGQAKLSVCRGVDQACGSNITQRKVLSFVSSIFDPLGLMSPFTVRGRLLGIVRSVRSSPWLSKNGQASCQI